MIQTICWLEYVKAFSPIVGTIVALLGAWLAYKYAVRKLRDENIANIERKKYEAILKAHERCWSLLMFTAENENAKSIITWVRSEDTKEDEYFFHSERCEQFFITLREVFYEEGCGIYLDQKVTKSIFHIRSILYGFQLKQKENNSKKIVINNKYLPREIFKLTTECEVAIREAIELDRRKLEFNK